MWEVGKKYTTKNNTDPRECLKVTDTYVLLDAQKKFPYSRPLSVEKVHWDCWKEYKSPAVLKAWVPVVKWEHNNIPVIAIAWGSKESKEVVQQYVKDRWPTYKLLDIIEVTWQEKE